jgi:hypothetical protein
VPAEDWMSCWSINKALTCFSQPYSRHVVKPADDSAVDCCLCCRM